MIRKSLQRAKDATFCIELPGSAFPHAPTAIGTGFFVSGDGWFVTAAHVITENNMPDGVVRSDLEKCWLRKESRPGQRGPMCNGVSLGRIFPEFDIAFLRVDFKENSNKHWLIGKVDFPSLNIAIDHLEEGEPVYAFGYPLSDSATQDEVPSVFRLPSEDSYAACFS